MHLSLISKIMDRSTHNANAYIPISFPKKNPGSNAWSDLRIVGWTGTITFNFSDA